MIKRYWALLLVLITITACSTARPTGKHMMWELRTPESTVYLVGSIHMADSSFYPLDNIYYEKLDSSRIFVTEVDLEQVDPMKMMKLVTLRNGKTLKDMVPEDVYSILMERLGKLGFPEDVANTFKPGFALMMAQLMNEDSEPKSFASLAEGIDIHLLNKAQKHAKLGLEDVGTQMTLLEKLIDVDPDKMKMYLNSNPDIETNIDLKQLFDAWKNADTETLEKVLLAESEVDEASKELMEEMLDNRNINMAKKIESYIVDGGTFYVVVGAGHLVGDKSIIKLLEEKGYTVNQL
jgi:uncharacterized protein YbaP (TraB family)